MTEPSPSSHVRSVTASPNLQLPGTTPPTARKRARSEGNGNGNFDQRQQPQPERKKRAPVACRMCKNRKIKCSNDRPKCLSCVRLQCDCLYPEDANRSLGEEPLPRILGALEEILARLPDLTRSVPFPSALYNAPHPEARLAIPTGSGSSHETELSNSTAEESFLSLPNDVSRNTSLEEVLRWPVFSSNATTATPQLSGLLMADEESGVGDSSDAYRKNAWHVLDNTRILLRVNQFLANVNIKNPILDRHTLLKDAMLLTETGLSWDARSCLVLIACALGAISTAFEPGPATTDGILRSRSDFDSQSRVEAESYYQSAQRRLGLLTRGLRASQCHLLSGIYCMYTLRPIEAWHSFYQASTLCLVHLKLRGSSHCGGNLAEFSDAQKSLEQRLFWSCLKSECEMLLELPLPQSSLYTIESPGMFPSPPPQETIEAAIKGPELDGRPPTRSPALNSLYPSHHPPSPSTPRDLVSLHHQSWFYYLTEISLLRLNNRIIRAFYSADSTTWTRMNVIDMCNEAHACERQLQQWVESLPHSIRFDETDPNPGEHSELQHMTWRRYVKIKRLLYRPFLYRLAHADHQDGVLHQLVQPYAEKCVLACVQPATYIGLRHRHHGTWFGCRESALSALILLAAQSTGVLTAMGLEAQSEQFIHLYIAHLKFWQEESVDIKVISEIIQRMCQESLSQSVSSG
ncbi:hypothetical protein PFICI_01570 [Pestalotiopsis fici W106-1]|uniref:Zn(2)-C6 fungal-type domain-containing protein n=1 Tax=Pestalotiopsis fici (strain W106-1 / CGMCC3.15140) TaxID=1229662 RepID=W3XQG0_PESFW|nr:uncharacterized protein PFICI_01570 [Pestalotiopsis fici W106-1]ETS87742.1 hypothetical protein PFICI_01570 [Pestalotiopsis fici W106-1]